MKNRFLVNMKRSLIGWMLTAGLAVSATVSAEEDVTLRVHHFLSPAAPMHTYFEDWKQRIEEQSDGRIQVQLYPAMQLGGTPPSLYDQARDGQVDIVWTLTGYTPDRFPKAEVFDLPFMPRDPSATAQAAHAFYEKHLTDEFKDVHMLTFFTHSPGAIHTREKLVRQPEDMRRLKMRGPSRVMTQYLDALGAQAVGMPVPAVPEALSRGVIDGTILPLEVVGPLRVDELAPNHTLFPSDESLYTSTMIVAMNKERYASLPDDLKAVIDANAGVKEALKMSHIMLEADQTVLDRIKKAGNPVHVVDKASLGPWKAQAKGIVDAWIEKMDGRGYDGQSLYDDAQAMIARYTGKK